MTYAHAPLPSDDPELDARRIERLAWNRVEQAAHAVAECPPRNADLPRRRYSLAVRTWAEALRQLDQVRA